MEELFKGTKKDIRHFEAFCESCRTIFYFDQKMPSGLFNLNIQRYGKTVILRFACSACPFCTFDEDILKDVQ